MKLNPDCIRDILLDIESVSSISNACVYDSDSPPDKLCKYSKEEIGYHARQCSKSNLVDGFRLFGDCETITVSDLTPKGHEFLANIRENKIWNGVKTISEKVGSASLDAITQIASNVITELIKAQFGISTIS